MSTIQTCLHRQTGPGHAENITEIHNVFFLCVFLLVVLFSYDFIWNSKWLALLQNWGVEIFHGRIVVSIKGSLKVNFRVTDFRKPIHHSQEMSQPWDLTAKRSHSQEISTSKRSHSQEISTAKRSHSQEISTAKRSPQPRDLTAKRSPQPRDLTAKRSPQPRDLTAKRSPQPRDLTAKRSHSQETHSQETLQPRDLHSQEISQPKDLTAKRSPQPRDLTAKRSPQPRDLTAKRSHSQETLQPRDLHSQEISQPKDLTAKRSPQPRDLTAKGSHSQEKSRTKASFSHLPLSDFREVSHASFVSTSCTFRFWRKSRTKASFSHLQLSLFEGSLARNPFLRDSRCTTCCVLQDTTCLGRWTGKLVRRTVSEHARLYRDHGRIGRAVELPVQALFCQRSCT